MAWPYAEQQYNEREVGNSKLWQARSARTYYAIDGGKKTCACVHKGSCLTTTNGERRIFTEKSKGQSRSAAKMHHYYYLVTYTFFIASVFLCFIFSAYVCHVTTAGSLGDQLKCDNQSINQINQYTGHGL